MVTAAEGRPNKKETPETRKPNERQTDKRIG
jgi:hypothetical protein